MKKILITGCSGYIGQHLTKLLSDSYEIYGLDIKEPEDISPFTLFSRWDIRHSIDDFVFISNDMPRFYDGIIHLAALVQVNESVLTPTKYYDTNINGTCNTLKNFSFDNFILASTGAASQPNCPYAYSKIAAEDITREICGAVNKDYTILRFYNVIGREYGINPTNPDGLFYNLMKSAETGKFTVFGHDYNTPDGTAIRDYVHVMDICRAIKMAIESPSNNTENLGTGIGHSVKEIAETFARVNNLDLNIQYGPRRKGDIEKTVLDNVSDYMIQSYKLTDLVKL